MTYHKQAQQQTNIVALMASASQNRHMLPSRSLPPSSQSPSSPQSAHRGEYRRSMQIPASLASGLYPSRGAPAHSLFSSPTPMSPLFLASGDSQAATVSSQRALLIDTIDDVLHLIQEDQDSLCSPTDAIDQLLQ
eukprot:CAMPEP_0198115042 /NCGR_PEP_ID=MMETSP1442-20131203/6248_1 /TAXON_ID= /ORGANISM="Craspedostauros australis, Strain CCMP3328" /LENGTH=134 /DNA_ID=CAMNT_0043772465 /DNA_START=148 /DNA_END=552 /DNA_ORIENTATION=+